MPTLENSLKNSDNVETIQFDTGASEPSYSAGQFWYDSASVCLTADTGISGVRTAIGQENYVPVYNNTGFQIDNGTPVSGVGTYTAGIPNAVESDADNINHILGFFGVATHNIPDGTVGLVTKLGAVKGVDTSTLSQAPVYLASGGGLTNTIPTYPTYRMLVGGATVIDASDGVIGVDAAWIQRSPISESYSFTSQGAGAGTYWEAGYYDWSATDANLTQASTSVTYGTAGDSKAAHVGIVPSGAGSVDTGQVGIRVTGTLDSETGAQTATQTQVISDDITTLTADVMSETAGKFSGQVTIELYVVSGSPTTYSLDFNYGFSKYEDFGNTDFTIIKFEAKWRGAANDTTADIALMHHKASGWTYAATGFVAGNGDVVRKTVDQQIEGNVSNGADGAYKRVNLNQFIEGSASEGLIIQVITGQPNTFQTLDLHIGGYSESVT